MNDSSAASDEEDVATPYDVRVLARLWPFVRKDIGLLIVGLALIPVSVGFEVAQPYLIKMAIDDHIAVGRIGDLGLLVLGYVGLVVLQSLTSFGQIYSFQLLGQRAVYHLRQALHRHVVSRRLAFFDTRPVGRLLTRMTGDVDTVNDIFASGAVTLLADFVKMAAIVILMLVLNVRLALITFVTLPVLVFVVRYARPVMRRSFRQERTTVAAMNAFIQEHVSGVKIVQIFGRENRAAREYDQLNGAHRDALLGSIKADAIMFAVVEAIAVSSGACIAWYSGARIGHTGLTVGLVVAFIEYVNKFFVPVRNVSAKYTVMQGSMAAAERIVALMDSEEPDAPDRGTLAVETSGDTREAVADDSPAVVLENVHFSYKKGEPVLRGVDLTVERGATVAVVGATGSGKSTILRLITRLYDLEQGTVRVGGRDITTIPISELRRQITVVSQDAFLFAGTIADNVRLGRADATDDEVRAALARVGALRLASRGTGGIDEVVTERGGNLSSGERQLIAFARALIRDPEVLILDEATAHIDPEVESLIDRGMAELAAGRTTLVVAHRLSTIRRADRIVVLSRGRVAEAGTHDELVAAGGLFARLESTFRAR